MSRSRGRRYDDDSRQLNMKKVIATIIVIIGIIMIVLSIKNLLSGDEKNKDVSTLTSYISVVENDKWGVIDNKGNIIIDLIYDEMIAIPNETQDIFVCTYNVDYSNETFDTKVINKNNEEILKEYDNITAIENTDGTNIWYEDNVLKFEKAGKYGLIDFEGEIIVEADYDKIYALSGIKDTLIVEKDGKKGLINNKTSEIIIDPLYKEIKAISAKHEDGYIVKNESNKFGLIANDKTKILAEKYDDIKNVTGNGYYVVVENGVAEIIDKTGRIILDEGFDSVEGIQLDNFIIIKDSKYGVIDKQGNTIIDPEYESIKFGTVESFVAQKDGKMGIIKKDGTVMIDFNYERISYIETADFFQAEKDNLKTDIIDRNFSKVLEDVIISEFNSEIGYLRIRSGEEYKYYNFKFEEKTNKEILSTNTLFLVKENGKYGYENKNGERVVDCIYDDAKEQNEFGYCAVKKDGKWGTLKSDGTVVVNPTRNLEEYLYIDFIAEWNRYNDLRLNVYTK